MGVTGVVGVSRKEDEKKELLRDNAEENGPLSRSMQRRPQQNNVLLRLTSCFVIVTTFTTVLLFLLLRQSNQQAASLSEAVSVLSLSSQQTQELLQQQTQQLEHIKQQNQQQLENHLSSSSQKEQREEKGSDVLLASSLSQKEQPVDKLLSSSSNKNNIESSMSRKDSDKKDNNNEEKYDEEHSCLSSNVTVSNRFCERTICVTHKMGYILAHTLFKNTSGFVVRQYKRESDKPRIIGKKDYRDVLIVRNMYESIVSGYLYHKSGRECHLDSNGKPWQGKPRVHNVQFSVYWDLDLVKTQKKVKRFVGTKNTSNSKKIDVHKTRPNQTMCDYLQETAESGGEHGVELALLTYMHIIFKLVYMKLLTNVDRVVGKIGDDQNRTLLVCFEDLEDPEQQPHVVQTILHFLFPADARGQQPRQRHLTATVPPAPPRAYSGGHATDHDPQVRAALKDIIRKLDVEYFDGVIAKYQAIIGCTYR